MSDSLTDAWKAYVAAEARGFRREYLSVLDEFLHVWAACAPEAQTAWASAFVDQWVAGGKRLPIREPLLERVILPHLVAEFNGGSATAAFLLAEVCDSPSGYGRAWDQMRLPTSIELLMEAHRRDPSSERIRKRLVEKQLGYVHHTLHEIPAGVLFGIDGATPSECVELETSLNELMNLMNEAERDEHQELLSKARFHYRKYREYLMQGERHGYQNYLARE